MFQDHFSHHHIFVCGVSSFTDRCIIVVACYLRFVDFAYVGTCMKKLYLQGGLHHLEEEIHEGSRRN